MGKKLLVAVTFILSTILISGLLIIFHIVQVQALTWTNTYCSGGCESGSSCNSIGDPPPGTMWSCYYRSSVGAYRCASEPTNNGGHSCYLSCSGGWKSCGCNEKECKNNCLDSISAGQEGNYTMICDGCRQKFTCSCFKPPTSCTPYKACPDACGSSASTQPDGNCGTHSCADVPRPARVECPTACGSSASTQPDGNCGTYTCAGTAPCCNSNFNMTITDTNNTGNCNVGVFTLSGLPSTHVQPSGGDINNVNGLCTNNSWPLQNPFTCNGVSNTGLTWTHRWREFGNSQYSTDCSKTVTTEYPLQTPTICLNSNIYDPTREITVDFRERLIFYNDPVTKFDLYGVYANTVNLSRITVLGHNTSPGGANTGFVNCGPWTVNPPGVPTTLTDRAELNTCMASQNEPYYFTYSYNRKHAICDNANLSINCSVDSPTVAATYYPGFLKTEKGDLYVGGPFSSPNYSIDQMKYPVAPPIINLSTYTFSTNQALNSISAPVPAVCSSNPTICSFKSYLLMNYNDNNHLVPLGTTWYAKFKDQLNQNPTITKDTTSYNSPTWFSGSGFYDTSKTLINITGDLTIKRGAICSGKNIFLISGDLTIDPDFTYLDDNACLFIVNQNTTINNSINGVRQQDTVQAFIITNTISTPNQNDDNWLLIKGGVITTNAPVYTVNKNSWGRNVNLNAAHNVFPYQPSEILEYEGARYINFFTNSLGSPSQLSIREIQYKP